MTNRPIIPPSLITVWIDSTLSIPKNSTAIYPNVAPGSLLFAASYSVGYEVVFMDSQAKDIFNDGFMDIALVGSPILVSNLLCNIFLVWDGLEFKLRIDRQGIRSKV